MPSPTNDNLLELLAEKQAASAAESIAAALAVASKAEAEAPRAELQDPVEALRRYSKAMDQGENNLDALCARISEMVKGDPSESTAQPLIKPDQLANLQRFVPLAPASLAETYLAPTQVEGLILKCVLNAVEITGRTIADRICLPFALIEPLLKNLKNNCLLLHKEIAQLGDFTYQVSERGRELARQLMQHSSYVGSAPVSLVEYTTSVKAQSISNQTPTMQNLQEAFADLRVNTRLLHLLGPALHSGRGIFLFGAPGNGKTSIAERITRAYGQSIWIPRTLGVNDALIRLYDPAVHEELPVRRNDSLLIDGTYDRRWVRIRRPTIVVGGELTMENLEVHENSALGMSEAPLQLKSNGGALVIDDLGRQRMRIDELLNRLIIPLEKRVDFLNLSNGSKIQVPFDQLSVFSTNFEPKDLVDEAFLRRIPYKIDVLDPSEEDYLALLEQTAANLGLQHDGAAFEYLIETHYKASGRPFRCCQPRDLLMQVRNHCSFHGVPFEVTPQKLDFAVESYFAVLQQ